ncbi:FAD-binding monooxygenase [Sphingomonas changnyeongensis]|uniref:FAD-binding monooxygenase n=1 Tax=Sphingomonas changnyeongensis TaxID=2698679 RepID=A0A7Z2NUI4_9SPHN|nr:FAD-binding monooxygenase [Sphingomonas changnyeongensis]QHL90063.1 FAD-binding monooxygenase [Sphingomonas changnyeongensis]
MRRGGTLILGGGPAGSAAAIALVQGGIDPSARPLLIERQREMGDAICGGFLSWQSLAALDRLGLTKLRGATLDHLRLFTPRGRADAPLPRPALGVSRRQLDSALLDLATSAGAAVERGVAVARAEGRQLWLADGTQLAADTLLLATGKHDLRGHGRPRDDADPSLGLRVRLGPAAGLSRLVGSAIELHLFDRGYAGLSLQEDGSANLCLALRKSRLIETGGPAGLLAAIGRESPALADRIAHLAPGQPIDAIAAVPYGWRTGRTTPGIFRLGDQCGVIPSLAGEGMGIALASGIAAARALTAGHGAEQFQAGFAARTRRPILVARTVLMVAERPSLAPALLALTRLAPGLAGLVARATRIGA